MPAWHERHLDDMGNNGSGAHRLLLSSNRSTRSKLSGAIHQMSASNEDRQLLLALEFTRAHKIFMIGPRLKIPAQVKGGDRRHEMVEYSGEKSVGSR